jgi:hypothetical protein
MILWQTLNTQLYLWAPQTDQAYILFTWSMPL